MTKEPEANLIALVFCPFMLILVAFAYLFPLLKSSFFNIRDVPLACNSDRYGSVPLSFLIEQSIILLIYISF
jgi:hypothetical protein